ncbi:MAG: helix-turn-helix domain-containing protein [Bacteroidota bacterium]
MNTFSDELRKEREARGITLAEIAKKTRINVKYLEAIEQGAFDVLPETYLRAFIKSYAETIGLSTSEVLYKYDLLVSKKYSEPSSAAESPTTFNMSPDTHKHIEQEKKKRHAVMIAGVLVLAALFGVALLDSISSSANNAHVEEAPFREVVKEQEQNTIPIAIDTLDTTAVATTLPAEPESLFLRVVASDSVWITIIRDSLPPRTGYLLKGRYRTYSAKNEFRFSADDASAITLYLNNVQLKPLGKKGERIRHLHITTKNLNQ